MSSIQQSSKSKSMLATLSPKTVLQGAGDIRRCVHELTPILAQTLPAHLKKSVDAVGSALVVEINKNPDLASCTAMSLIGCLMQASSLGLRIGGALGQAYLIPFRNRELNVYESQFVVGYKGLIFLAGMSGRTKVFDSYPVYKGEAFSIRLGTDPVVEHTPSIEGAPTEADLIGVYAYAVTTDGSRQVEWMTKDQIEIHRNKYSKMANGPAWKGSFVEMARKTPLRRLAKRLPLSPDMTLAASLDEMADEGIDQGLRSLVAEAIQPDVSPPSNKALRVESEMEQAEIRDDEVPR